MTPASCSSAIAQPRRVRITAAWGGGDEKIVAAPSSVLTQRCQHVKTFTDLPEITCKQIEHFFLHYKDLEPGKWVKLTGWGHANEARRLIDAAISRICLKE
ncbi:inorganic diphosphatase [Bradyrhizobium murdochi]|uniref:inorganic diphosphatase n=1 Tax=Bradyrhizobium murdochi TaxID=1038859 RepID=UPI000A016BF0